MGERVIVRRVLGESGVSADGDAKITRVARSSHQSSCRWRLSRRAAEQALTARAAAGLEERWPGGQQPGLLPGMHAFRARSACTWRAIAEKRAKLVTAHVINSALHP
jgi:hypothetical protein